MPRPSVSAIASSNQGRTLTISGTGLNRLRSIHVGDHAVHFTILSPRKVRATVPLNWQPNGTLISLAFAKITISWKKCSSCTDQWGPSG